MRNVFLAAALLSGGSLAQTAPVQDLTGLLEPLRVGAGAPSLAGVVVVGDQVYGTALSGTVAAGGAPVTSSSTFELGAMAATMTATVIARLVERGLLGWDSTLGDVLTDVKMLGGYRTVPLKALLSARSGMPFDLLSFKTEPLGAARKAYLEQALSEPAGPSGVVVSNVARVAAAMMAEKVSGKTWAALMQDELFGPLGMNGCVVGIGTSGDPFPHRWNGDKIVSQPYTAANPAVRNGADGVRCTLAGLAPFLRAHLLGESGGSAYLKPASWKTLHTDPMGTSGRYGLEWGISGADWTKGPLLLAGGNDTNNTCVVWVIPGRNVAVMVATNIGMDEKGSTARTDALLNDAVNTLVREAFRANP
ncbi:serine hydrolase domain-containing protein [Deinococcus sp.]|uniref:serine hydrolase domain-containing protein n=1 Tax=Deinococcus sp. TaxID=47478 RepID=UPI002869A8ED|nr:serine hydrolase domain-containing protein [Deinococcus sp.]